MINPNLSNQLQIINEHLTNDTKIYYDATDKVCPFHTYGDVKVLKQHPNAKVGMEVYSKIEEFILNNFTSLDPNSLDQLRTNLKSKKEETQQSADSFLVRVSSKVYDAYDRKGMLAKIKNFETLLNSLNIKEKVGVQEDFMFVNTDEILDGTSSPSDRSSTEIEENPMNRSFGGPSTKPLLKVEGEEPMSQSFMQPEQTVKGPPGPPPPKGPPGPPTNTIKLVKPTLQGEPKELTLEFKKDKGETFLKKEIVIIDHFLDGMNKLLDPFNDSLKEVTKHTTMIQEFNNQSTKFTDIKNQILSILSPDEQGISYFTMMKGHKTPCPRDIKHQEFATKWNAQQNPKFKITDEMKMSNFLEFEKYELGKTMEELEKETNTLINSLTKIADTRKKLVVADLKLGDKPDLQKLEIDQQIKNAKEILGKLPEIRSSIEGNIKSLITLLKKEESTKKLDNETFEKLKKELTGNLVKLEQVKELKAKSSDLSLKLTQSFEPIQKFADTKNQLVQKWKTQKQKREDVLSGKKEFELKKPEMEKIDPKQVEFEESFKLDQSYKELVQPEMVQLKGIQEKLKDLERNPEKTEKPVDKPVDKTQDDW